MAQGRDPHAARLRTAPRVALGATGVLAVATGVSGILMLSAKGDYDSTSLEREATIARNRYDDFRTLSLVGLAATVVGAAVTVALYVTQPAFANGR